MNKHAKRAVRAICELGFEFDEEITQQHRSGKSYYVHPLAPDEAISVYAKLDEHAARCVIDRARQIAGLDATGAKRRNAAIKQRRREQAAKKREADLREWNARQERAAATATKRAMDTAIARRDRRERELRDLMMPGRHN